MLHIRKVLARRTPERDLSSTAHLTDGAATALQVGRVDQALRIYRELERLEGHNPTWPLRVAECYRRLSQRDGEVSALMRAASRYESRGFIREALALWKRVQTADPHHSSSRVAVERLEPSQGLGLERMRSSLPATVRHPSSHVEEVKRRSPEAGTSVMPTIPAAPPLPVIEEAVQPDREGPMAIDMLDEDDAAADTELSPSLPIDTVEEGFASEPSTTRDEAAFTDGPLRLDAPPVVEPLPATMRAAEVDMELAHRIADELDASIVAQRRSRPLDLTPSAAQLPAVILTPVIPVAATPPSSIPIRVTAPSSAPIAALPIIAVGDETEPDTEVEFAEAEVLPCLDEIDPEW